jgi:hypothetical protein
VATRRSRNAEQTVCESGYVDPEHLAQRSVLVYYWVVIPQEVIYMPRVPITVMGYHCERCDHEWIPRDLEQDPSVCPKCKSPYWNRPRKATSMLTYEDFRDKIHQALRDVGAPITWTEIRTAAKLPEKFPNNKWVHRLEQDISLRRNKDAHGIIKWSLAD